MPHEERAVYRAAIELAYDAGRLIRERAGRPRQVEFKGEIDLVTEADKAAERLIADGIAARFPGHALVGEEGTTTGVAVADAEWVWVVDPLDGTTNFTHGYPHFATSILVMRQGEMHAAAVYNPMADELFAAEAGAGAWLNGRPLRVSTTVSLQTGLFGTGFSYRPDLRDEQHLVWEAVQRRTRGVRREGAAALGMCYVAAGRLDGFWERPINAWDIGAGALLIREAGGTVTALEGGPFDVFAGEVTASNGLVHDELLGTIVGSLGVDDSAPAESRDAAP